MNWKLFKKRMNEKQPLIDLLNALLEAERVGVETARLEFEKSNSKELLFSD